MPKPGICQETGFPHTDCPCNECEALIARNFAKAGPANAVAERGSWGNGEDEQEPDKASANADLRRAAHSFLVPLDESSDDELSNRAFEAAFIDVFGTAHDEDLIELMERQSA